MRTLTPRRVISANASVPLAVGTKYGDTSSRFSLGSPNSSLSCWPIMASAGALPRALSGSSLTMRVGAHSRGSLPCTNCVMNGNCCKACT
ncbi:hypothetical protein D3C80_1182880 [compost metagenome]